MSSRRLALLLLAGSRFGWLALGGCSSPLTVAEERIDGQPAFAQDAQPALPAPGPSLEDGSPLGTEEEAPPIHDPPGDAGAADGD